VFDTKFSNVGDGRGKYVTNCADFHHNYLTYKAAMTAAQCNVQPADVTFAADFELNFQRSVSLFHQ